MKQPHQQNQSFLDQHFDEKKKTAEKYPRELTGGQVFYSSPLDRHVAEIDSLIKNNPFDCHCGQRIIGLDVMAVWYFWKRCKCANPQIAESIEKIYRRKEENNKNYKDRHISVDKIRTIKARIDGQLNFKCFTCGKEYNAKGLRLKKRFTTIQTDQFFYVHREGFSDEEISIVEKIGVKAVSKRNKMLDKLLPFWRTSMRARGGDGRIIKMPKEILQTNEQVIAAASPTPQIRHSEKERDEYRRGKGSLAYAEASKPWLFGSEQYELDLLEEADKTELSGETRQSLKTIRAYSVFEKSEPLPESLIDPNQHLRPKNKD